MFSKRRFCFEITIAFIDRTLEWLFITVYVIDMLFEFIRSDETFIAIIVKTFTV